MDRGPWTVDRGPWTVDRRPWTVDRGPEARTISIVATTVRKLRRRHGQLQSLMRALRYRFVIPVLEARIRQNSRRAASRTVCFGR